MRKTHQDRVTMVSNRPSNPSLKPSASSSSSSVVPPDQWLTFRVDFIPSTASAASLPKYFAEQDRSRLKVVTLVPSLGRRPHDSEDARQTAILSFAPKPGGTPYPRQIDERVRTDTVRMDADFVGFTPLNICGEVAVDVIFFPAIGSHPYLTWCEGYTPNGDCWPISNLPKAVPRCRVLLYGYNPEDYEDPENNIYNKAETFLRRFHRLRQAERRESRPVVFVGHSTGCLVLKRVLWKSALDVEADLIKSVIFLGAPHDGFDQWTCSLISNGQMSEKLLHELAPGSPTILALNAEFAPIADLLHIVACYETRETLTELVWPELLVRQDTATLFKSTMMAIDSDHRGLAWAQKREAGLYDDIVGSIKDAINKVTKPAGWKAQTFSNGGPTSPTMSERLSEEESVSSSLKSMTLGSSALSPPKPARLDRSQTTLSEVSSRTNNTRKKSIPFMIRKNSRGDESSREAFALHDALRHREFGTAHALVERYVNFDLKDSHNDNRTAMHEAAIAGDAEVVRALLEAGAMSEPRTHLSFRTPLHYASLMGHYGVVKLLLDNGVKINAKSADETTALHNAALKGHSRVVKLLVDRGAGINTPSGAGKSPLDVSREVGNTEISEYLWNKGSRPNPRKPSKAPTYPGLF